jgi:endoglucanase
MYLRFLNLLVLVLLKTYSFAQPLSDKIKVNQCGYLINHEKKAYVSNINTTLHTTWYLQGTSGTVYTSLIPNGTYDAASGDTVFKLDFSTINTPGIYYVEVQNLGTSFTFEISDAAYNNVFKAVSKSYYYQRCGMDLEVPYAGIWQRNACHLNDGYIYNGFSNGNIVSGPFLKSTGGWHDAGDFGKKIVPAATSMYHMLKLIELIPGKVDSANLVIPADSFDMPDLLKEVKYELDWFMTQQRPDGAVYHLVTSQNFFYTDMPDKDLQTRYSVPVSSTATADFAAIMALASKVYRAYNTSYSDSCLNYSIKAWTYLKNNPQIFPAGGYQDPPGINYTGQYTDTADRDDRLWAAAELYNTTGDTSYQNYFDQKQSYWTYAVAYPGGWNNVQSFAMFTYAFATLLQPGNTIGNTIRTQINAYATWTSQNINTNGYGIALSPNDFYWGSNSVLLIYGADLLMAHLLSPNPAFETAALSHLNYILGANALNLSFVTGIGSKRVMDPHQDASTHDGILDPVPGFVPGGPNKYADPNDQVFTAYVNTHHPTPAKSYVDSHWAYSCNEVSVNMMSALVFLSGYFYNHHGTPLYTATPTDLIEQSSLSELSAHPNPLSGKTQLNFFLHKQDKVLISILDSSGKEIKKTELYLQTGNHHIVLDFTDIPEGIYSCRVNTSTNSKMVKLVIYK